MIETGLEALADELARIEPAELMLTEAVRMALADARLVLPGAIQPVDAALFDSEAAAERIAEAFGGEVDPTACSRGPGGRRSARCIAYVRETQKGGAAGAAPAGGRRGVGPHGDRRRDALVARAAGDAARRAEGLAAVARSISA